MCDHHFPGKVCLPDPAFVAADGTGVPVISLDANSGDVFIGGPAGGLGHRGRLVINDQNGNPAFVVEGRTGEVTSEGDIVLRDNSGRERIRISGEGAELVVRDAEGHQTIHLDGGERRQAVLSIGGEDSAGSLLVRDRHNWEAVKVEGSRARLSLGGPDKEGELILRGETDPPRLEMNPFSTKFRLTDDRTAAELNSYVPALMVGCRDKGGYLRVRDDRKMYVFEFRGPEAHLRIGAPNNGGSLEIRDMHNNAVLAFDGRKGQLELGNECNDGRLIVRDEENRDVLSFRGLFARLQVGTKGRAGRIWISDSSNRHRIRLDGECGEICLSNNHIAEQFDLADSVTAEPGMVVVLNDEGKVEPSSVPYDTKVVGVVAGAQPGEHPGIVLDHWAEAPERVAVAMCGKARCLANAFPGAIAVGDLLTTSAEEGRAMAVRDPSRAVGAILGKALTSLREDTYGLIEVMLTLQ